MVETTDQNYSPEQSQAHQTLIDTLKENGNNQKNPFKKLAVGTLIVSALALSLTHREESPPQTTDPEPNPTPLQHPTPEPLFPPTRFTGSIIVSSDQIESSSETVIDNADSTLSAPSLNPDKSTLMPMPSAKPTSSPVNQPTAITAQPTFYELVFQSPSKTPKPFLPPVIPSRIAPSTATTTTIESTATPAPSYSYVETIYRQQKTMMALPDILGFIDVDLHLNMSLGPDQAEPRIGQFEEAVRWTAAAIYALPQDYQTLIFRNNFQDAVGNNFVFYYVPHQETPLPVISNADDQKTTAIYLDKDINMSSDIDSENPLNLSDRDLYIYSFVAEMVRRYNLSQFIATLQPPELITQWQKHHPEWTLDELRGLQIHPRASELKNVYGREILGISEHYAYSIGLLAIGRGESMRHVVDFDFFKQFPYDAWQSVQALSK